MGFMRGSDVVLRGKNVVMVMCVCLWVHASCISHCSNNLTAHVAFTKMNVTVFSTSTFLCSSRILHVKLDIHFNTQIEPPLTMLVKLLV
jgi:hypothetical protein